MVPGRDGVPLLGKRAGGRAGKGCERRPANDDPPSGNLPKYSHSSCRPGDQTVMMHFSIYGREKPRPALAAFALGAWNHLRGCLLFQPSPDVRLPPGLGNPTTPPSPINGRTTAASASIWPLWDGIRCREELICASRVKEASEHLIAYDPYIKGKSQQAPSPDGNRELLHHGADPNGDRRRQLDLDRDALPLLHRICSSSSIT